MGKLHLAVAIALFGLCAPARADADLREQISKPIVAVLKSSKSPSDLQLCVADAIGEGLLPVPFPADTAGTVHIFGFAGLMGAGTVQRVVSLMRTPNGTRIEVRTRTSRVDSALVNSLQSCL